MILFSYHRYNFLKLLIFSNISGAGLCKHTAITKLSSYTHVFDNHLFCVGTQSVLRRRIKLFAKAHKVDTSGLFPYYILYYTL